MTECRFQCRITKVVWQKVEYLNVGWHKRKNAKGRIKTDIVINNWIKKYRITEGRIVQDKSIKE